MKHSIIFSLLLAFLCFSCETVDKDEAESDNSKDNSLQQITQEQPYSQFIAFSESWKEPVSYKFTYTNGVWDESWNDYEFSVDSKEPGTVCVEIKNGDVTRISENGKEIDASEFKNNFQSIKEILETSKELMEPASSTFNNTNPKQLDIEWAENGEIQYPKIIHCHGWQHLCKAFVVEITEFSVSEE